MGSWRAGTPATRATSPLRRPRPRSWARGCAPETAPSRHCHAPCGSRRLRPQRAKPLVTVGPAAHIDQTGLQIASRTPVARRPGRRSGATGAPLGCGSGPLPVRQVDHPELPISGSGSACPGGLRGRHLGSSARAMSCFGIPGCLAPRPIFGAPELSASNHNLMLRKRKRSSL